MQRKTGDGMGTLSPRASSLSQNIMSLCFVEEEEEEDVDVDDMII